MGNSTSSPKTNKALMTVLDKTNKKTAAEGAPHKQSRRSSTGPGGKLRRSKRSSSTNQAHPDIKNVLKSCDLNDILELVKELKKDQKGQELLNDYVRAQVTEASTKESQRILALMEEEDAAAVQFPISEICIEGTSAA